MCHFMTTYALFPSKLYDDLDTILIHWRYWSIWTSILKRSSSLICILTAWSPCPTHLRRDDSIFRPILRDILNACHALRSVSVLWWDRHDTEAETSKKNIIQQKTWSNLTRMTWSTSSDMIKSKNKKIWRIKMYRNKHKRNVGRTVLWCVCWRWLIFFIVWFFDFWSNGNGGSSCLGQSILVNPLGSEVSEGQGRELGPRMMVCPTSTRMILS